MVFYQVVLCPLCLLCLLPQPELMPVMAVGTSGGSTFLINPDTMTLYAKLRWVLSDGCWEQVGVEGWCCG